MMRFLIIVIFSALGIYLVWQWIDPIVIVRYRLTICVGVGDQIKTGSGVLQVTSHNNWIFPEGGPWTGFDKGEAVVVDLGPAGLLVVTLAEDGARERSRGVQGLKNLAAGPLPDGGFFSDWLWEINLRNRKIDVPLEQLPMLARFRDRADRQSFERVEPSDLGGVFGPEIRLLRATVEIVPSGYWPFNLSNLGMPQWLFGTPVTEGLEKSLPWLVSWDGITSRLLNRPKGNTPEYNPRKSDFVRGN